jgi:hypothetical protein
MFGYDMRFLTADMLEVFNSLDELGLTASGAPLWF